MLALQRAFSHLRVAVSSTAQNAGTRSGLLAEGISCAQLSLPSRTLPQTLTTPVCTQCYSTSSSKKDNKAEVKNYDPPSPYRSPGPRRYGYEARYFTDGLLPRGEDLGRVHNLPKYKVKDTWNKKRALFGQNDYIDILGDGSIRPEELIHGPDWLIGFKGNELQRLVRRLNFHGDKLKLLYPHKYHNIQKRIFFLHKKYNKKRGKRVSSQRRS